MKNTRDFIVVLVAVLIIGVSGFLIYQQLFPKSSQTQSATTTNLQSQDNNKYVKPNVDSQTYNDVSKLSNYPKPSLDNIGRTDIFANF